MLEYRVELAPAAIRQLASLTKRIQVKIAGKIDGLRSDPRPHGCVKLKGSEDIYRIRVGEHRVLYQVRDDVLLVLVVKVGKRERVYKG